jgi:hypothetical protein
MDKALFEQYVVEAAQLRQQVDILLRVINLITSDEDYQFFVTEVEKTAPSSIRIEEGKIYVNPQ